VLKIFIEKLATYRDSTVNCSDFIEQLSEHTKYNKTDIYYSRFIIISSSTEYLNIKLF
jgi:hypothetical protein